MKLLAALVGVLGAAGAFAQADAPDVTLTLAGKSVPITIPKGPDAPPPGEYIPFQGWNYRVGRNAEVLDRYAGNGGWSEVRQLWNVAKDKVKSGVPWKVKAFVLMRTVDPANPSGLIRNRYNLDPAGQAEALRQLGLFKVMAESYSGGAYRIELSVEIVNETTSSFPLDFLSANVNSGEFQADDKVDRGPWDSIVAISANPHAEGIAPIGTQMAHVPAVAVSLYPAGSSVLDCPATDTMYRLWAGSVRRAFMEAHQPWPLPDFEFGSSQVVRRMDILDRSGVISRWASQLSGTSWHSGEPDPTPSLPMLPPALESGRGIVGGGTGILVPPKFAPFLASQLSQPRLEGKRSTSEGLLLQFHHDGSAFRWKDAVQGSQEAIAGTDQWATLGKSTANVIASSKEGVVAYQETGPVRYGKVELFGGKQVNLTATKSVRFKVKSQSSAALWLFVEGRDSSLVPIAGVSGDPLATFGAVLPVANLTPDGKWQEFTLPVSVGKTTRVFIGANGERKRTLGPIAFEVSELGFSDETAGLPTTNVTPNPRGSEFEKALYAKQEGASADALISLLSDGSPSVVAKAAQTLSQMKAPKAVPTLIKLSSSLDPDIAESAINALAFQGTPESKLEIRRLVAEGPLDLNRQIAAQRLAAEEKADDAGLISQLFGARGWAAKIGAANAISTLKGPNSQVILLAFLLDDEPLVRLTVIRLADLSQEVVQRRILWASVNDPSDEVRVASLLRLLESQNQKLKAEGTRGVRDESRYVRYRVLQAMPNQEESRSALRIAVADSDVEIRSLALAKFALLPGAVSAEEVSIALDDAFPAVQIEALKLIKAKGVPVSDSQKNRFKASVSSEVVGLAKELWP
jgi:HEAT repeat protein